MDNITCEICDDYDHLDDGDNLEYILENVLSEETNHSSNTDDNDGDDYYKLKELYNTLLINKCQCDETVQCSKCFHGGNYIFNAESQELVINPEKKKGDLIYECTAMCKCNRRICLNRLVQYGPRKGLKIIESQKYHSKGVVTTKPIPKGAFICEYAGELLTSSRAKTIQRENEMEHKMNYVLCLKEAVLPNLIESNDNSKMLLTIVNPSRKGNIGRYLNHSCQPNCQIFSVRIDCPVPKIAIFSGRPIEAGEELCFHYNEGITCDNFETLANNERILCLCGSQHCNKYLPNFEL